RRRRPSAGIPIAASRVPRKRWRACSPESRTSRFAFATPNSETSMKTKLLLLAALLPATALATTTRSFRVTSYADFDAGEAKGVLISSLGEITTGYATKRLDIPVAFVRSSIEGPGGAVYLGTGDQGELWVWEKGKLRKIAKLGEAVEITSLAVGGDGTVYAGAAPGGKIWAVKGNTV